jgi:hypothetical protein
MEVFELKEWSTAPAFAAPGVTLDPDEPGFLHVDRPTWIILFEGSARHRSTDLVLKAPCVLRIDAGEAMDLEVLTAVRYWRYSLAT